jgi:hypothetical protein
VETFVIQVWAPKEANEPKRNDLRGFAEHVPSGERTAFRRAAELVAFIEAHRDDQQPEESER